MDRKQAGNDAAPAIPGDVENLSDRWFAKVVQEFPDVGERVSHCEGATAIVVSNCWGLGAPSGTYAVSLIEYPAGLPIKPITRGSPVTNYFGRLTYVLTFDRAAEALRFAGLLAGHLRLPVENWIDEDDTLAMPGSGDAA